MVDQATHRGLVELMYSRKAPVRRRTSERIRIEVSAPMMVGAARRVWKKSSSSNVSTDFVEEEAAVLTRKKARWECREVRSCSRRGA